MFGLRCRWRPGSSIFFCLWTQVAHAFKFVQFDFDIRVSGGWPIFPFLIYTFFSIFIFNKLMSQTPSVWAGKRQENNRKIRACVFGVEHEMLKCPKLALNGTESSSSLIIWRIKSQAFSCLWPPSELAVDSIACYWRPAFGRRKLHE